MASKQTMPKSPGLAPVGELQSFDDVEKHLQQLNRVIDALYLQIYNQTSQINRDELPNLQGQIDAIEVGESDFNIPMLTDVAFSYKADYIIEWTEGTLTYGGTTYTVEAGESDPCDIVVWVDVNTLADPVVLGHDVTVTIGTGRWVMANRVTTSVYQVLQSPIIHGGVIQANTITADQIAAGAVSADEIAANAISVGDMDTATAERIFSTSAKRSTIEGWESGASTYIAPGKVLISGSTYLSSWADSTNINGSVIKAASVDDGALNSDCTGRMFSTTGDKSSIYGWGYGGAVTYIDGGDIYTGTVTAAKINVADLFAQDITFTNAIHSANKTTYADTDAGLWMGLDGATPKFNIGDSDDYIKWDGTNLTSTGITGSSYTLTGSNITCDSLTAKDSVQVGPDNASGVINMKVVGGASYLRAFYANGDHHTIVQLSGDAGLETFYRDNETLWPTNDGTITGTPSTTYRMLYTGGSVYEYALTATKIYATWWLKTPAVQLDPQSSAPSVSEGGIYYDSDDDAAYLRDASTWRKISVAGTDISQTDLPANTSFCATGTYAGQETDLTVSNALPTGIQIKYLTIAKTPFLINTPTYAIQYGASDYIVYNSGGLPLTAGEVVLSGSSFTVKGNTGAVNDSGGTYVWYASGHD